MRQKSFRSFSRAAMMLLMMLLTATTAGAADVTTNITYDGVAASDVTVSVTYTGEGTGFDLTEVKHETLSNNVNRFYPLDNTVVTIAVTSSASITTTFSATYDSFVQNEPLTVNTDGNNCTFTPAPGLNTTLNITVRPAGGQVYYVHYSTGNEFGVSGSMADQTFYVGVPQTLSPCGFTRADFGGLSYFFMGWATTNGGPVVYSDGQEVTNIASAGETITLYAQWTPGYRVHFDANGGMGTMADQTFTLYEVKTLSPCGFNRTGYRFTGWNTDAEGNGTAYADKKKISLNGNLTLYAQWTPTYTVHFDSNANDASGTMSDQTFGIGQSQALTANGFSRTGYAFKGWNTKADGKGTPYANKASVTNLTTTAGATVTLYAQWTPTYTVSYVDENGTETSGISAIPLDGTETTLDGGTYYVGSNIYYNHPLRFTDSSVLILGNGCTMSVGSENARVTDNVEYTAIYFSGSNNLDIYAQSTNPTEAGTLSVYGSKTAIKFYNGSYHQHSGNVIANAYENNKNGIDVGHFTLGSGTLNVTSDDGDALSASGNVNINGGQLDVTTHATGTVYFGIKTNGSINLGWRNSTDYIKVDSYNAAYGTINVATGQRFVAYDGTTATAIIASGTVDNSTIGGKKLCPIDGYLVTSNDAYVTIGNGTPTFTIAPTDYYVYANGSSVTLSNNREGYICNYTAKDANNADVTITNGTFTMPTNDVTVSAIWKKQITITANSDTKTYDGTPLTNSGYAVNTTLESGDAIESVSMTGSQTNVGTSDNVPSAAVIKNGSNEDVTANYDITYVNGTLTINPKAVTVTADNKTKICGDADPELTATVVGTIGSDVIDYSLSREAGEAVGTYTITVTPGTNANYTLTPVAGTFSITPIILSETTEIAAQIKGKEVQFTRSFTADKASSICLPFTYTPAASEGTYYTFAGIEHNGNEYVATMTATATTLNANTPYVFMPTATGEVIFSGVATKIPDANDASALTTTSGNWSFKGTYSPLTYGTAPFDGYVYGFASTTKTVEGEGTEPIQAGQFVHAKTGASVPSLRCYLKYKDGQQFTGAGARGMTRADEDLPQTITVRFIGANGEVTAIGTLNTQTGEIVTDGWYTLSGTRLSGKPSKRGIYINNGRKVVLH